MQMLRKISKLILTHPLFWRILGFVSSIVAFTCFALSSSFHDLFGSCNLLKISIYSVASLILATLMLIIKKCRRFTSSVLVKAHVGFLVMMLTSLCSIWQDLNSQKENDENGSRGRILNICSVGAFSLMSLSLSRQLELGFEVGIFNFSFGSFLVLLMKMNFKLAPLAAILCYVIIHIRSFSDYFMEKLGRVHSSDTTLEDMESGSRTIHLQQMNVPEHSLHNGISDTLEVDTYLSEDDNHLLRLGNSWTLGGPRAIHKRPKLEGEDDLKEEAKSLTLGWTHRAALHHDTSQVGTKFAILKSSNSNKVQLLDLNLTPFEKDLDLMFVDMRKLAKHFA
ncbi:hypothetical protein K1719_017426 [Acacia pycnantha]|nr:hypothetical protein K1719_017426 [Acacia pycnantha]